MKMLNENIEEDMAKVERLGTLEDGMAEPAPKTNARVPIDHLRRERLMPSRSCDMIRVHLGRKNRDLVFL
jgi:hypothetical protein